MKKAVIVGLVFCLGAASGFGYGQTYIAELENDIAELQREIAELESEIVLLETRVSELVRSNEKIVDILSRMNPQQREGRPAEDAEPSSVLDLRSLDSSLTPSSDTGSRSGSTEGSPATQPNTGTRSTSAQEGREGIVILWDDPSQVREPTSTPRPQIPAWVSEQGLRLQVVVSFELTPQGVLQDVKVDQGSGYSDVDAAVLEALRRWKFRPVSSTRTVTGRVPYTIIPR